MAKIADLRERADKIDAIAPGMGAPLRQEADTAEAALVNPKAAAITLAMATPPAIQTPAAPPKQAATPKAPKRIQL